MTAELGLGGIMRLDGRYVGRMQGMAYVTDRGPFHYYDKHRGFGITVSVLRVLERKGECNRVVVRYRSPEWSMDYSQDLAALAREPIVQEGDNDEQRILRVPREDHDRLHWALVDAREAW